MIIDKFFLPSNILKSFIMKKLLQFLALLLLTSFSIQTKAQNTCETPYLFESGTVYNYSFPTGTTAQSGINYDCLGTQPNPMWFYFKICEEGDMQISINSTSTTSDTDFIIWGPLTDQFDCNLVTSLVKDCNYDPAPLTSINLDSLQLGYYKLLITNYSNFSDYITLQQIGGSSLTCGGCLPNAHQICKVTTDDILNKNVISWVKKSSFDGEFNIQKETTTAGVYNTIGTVLSSDSSFFIDSLSNPIQQAYKYRLETLDTCGNIRYSNYHQTIHLQNYTNPGTSNMELSWTPYIGINYPTYYIYRGSSPLNLMLYDSISSSFTTYTDVNPNPSELYYSVVVYLSTSCTYTGTSKLSIDTIKSNISIETMVSIEENKNEKFTLYPNPTKDFLTVSFGTETISARFELMDIYGRIISTKNIENTTKFEISVVDLPQGYYVVNINSDKGISRKTFVKSN